MAIRLTSLLGRMSAQKMGPATTYSNHFIVSDWQGMGANPLVVAIRTALYGRTYSLCNMSRTPPSDDSASVSNADLLRPSTTSSLGRCMYSDDGSNNDRRRRRGSRDPCEFPTEEQKSWTRVPDPCSFKEVDEVATARLRACYHLMRNRLRRRSVCSKKGGPRHGRRRRRRPLRRTPQRKPRKRWSGGLNRRKCGKPPSGPPLPKR